MVEPIAGPSGMAFPFPTTPPPGTSLERVDRVRCGWVLMNNINQPRKKKSTKVNNFILVYTTYSIYNAPNMMVLHFPHTSRSLQLPSILPSGEDACFWLVVVCIFIGRRPSKAMVYFMLIYFLLLNLLPQTMGRCPPTRYNPHAPPLQHFPYCFCRLLGGCCVALVKRRPPKAETPPLFLFFNGLDCSAPNKGTNNGESATNAASLVWAHREQQHQALDPWWILPWRERPKAAEG